MFPPAHLALTSDRGGHLQMWPQPRQGRHQGALGPLLCLSGYPSLSLADLGPWLLLLSPSNARSVMTIIM